VADASDTTTARQLSEAIGERLLKCMDEINAMYDEFVREESPGEAAGDAVRTYLTGAVVYLSGVQFPSDAVFRTFLHELLDLAIADYHENERLHPAKGD
jgi:hypothetical protein